MSVVERIIHDQTRKFNSSILIHDILPGILLEQSHNEVMDKFLYPRIISSEGDNPISSDQNQNASAEGLDLIRQFPQIVIDSNKLSKSDAPWKVIANKFTSNKNALRALAANYVATLNNVTSSEEYRDRIASIQIQIDLLVKKNNDQMRYDPSENTQDEITVNNKIQWEKDLLSEIHKQYIEDLFARAFPKKSVFK